MYALYEKARSSFDELVQKELAYPIFATSLSAYENKP